MLVSLTTIIDSIVGTESKCSILPFQDPFRILVFLNFSFFLVSKGCTTSIKLFLFSLQAQNYRNFYQSVSSSPTKSSLLHFQPQLAVNYHTTSLCLHFHLLYKYLAFVFFQSFFLISVFDFPAPNIPLSSATVALLVTIHYSVPHSFSSSPPPQMHNPPHYYFPASFALFEVQPINISLTMECSVNCQ